MFTVLTNNLLETYFLIAYNPTVIFVVILKSSESKSAVFLFVCLFVRLFVSFICSFLA